MPLYPWRHKQTSISRTPQQTGFAAHGSSIRDGISPIMYFQTPVTQRNVLICIPPKVASTSWRLLMLMATSLVHPERVAMGVGGRNRCTYRVRVGRLKEALQHHRPITPRDVLSTDPHCVNFAKLAASSTDFDDAMADAKTLRIMLVRSPYTRLLSGFLDKITRHVGGSGITEVPLMSRSPDGFAQFATQWLFPEAVRSHEFQNHFGLQADYCKLDAPITHYDYYLKIEEMADWYAPLLRVLELEEAARSGWNQTTSYWRGRDDHPCFYTARDRRCEEMLPRLSSASEDANEQAPTLNTASTSAARVDRGHSTGAADQLAYYFNSTIAQLATRWFERDLKKFGYRAWSGAPAHYTLKR
jgi:hypothetical protein